MVSAADKPTESNSLFEKNIVLLLISKLISSPSVEVLALSGGQLYKHVTQCRFRGGKPRRF